MSVFHMVNLILDIWNNFDPFCNRTHVITILHDMRYVRLGFFGKQLQEDKHPHLRNFYAIVQPLTVNYVEHMIAAKEKISKNNFFEIT